MNIVIDIETKSGNPIDDGVHKYFSSPEFSILLVGYHVLETEERGVLDLVNEAYMTKLGELLNSGHTLHAFNVDFEFNAFKELFPFFVTNEGRHLWHDIQVDTMQLGLPGGLNKAAAVLGVGSKDTKGKSLIQMFSVPKGKGYGLKLQDMDPAMQEQWLEFKKYCAQDVALEAEILLKVNPWLMANITEDERRIEILSDAINQRGVPVDVEYAKWLDATYQKVYEDVKQELKDLTDLENPNSNTQFSAWLKFNGCNIMSVTKEELRKLDKSKMPEFVADAIQARLDLGSAIPKKYATAISMALPDNRLRGLFKYYGANRTGRWTSSGYQLHNMARTKTEIAELLYGTFQHNKAIGVQVVYKLAKEYKMSKTEVIGQCVRSILSAPDDMRFVVADFSAIEARVAAWLADEQWVLDVFETDGRIYERTAAKMFNVDIAEVTAESTMRRKGKYAVLALGYGGGVNALARFGADEVMSPREMDSLVALWRQANSNIVRAWTELEKAAKAALANRGNTYPACGARVAFRYDAKQDVLWLILPSGRRLAYYKPRVSSGTLKYLSSTLGAQGVYDSTYGGKLMENVCQAVARDLLGAYMLNIDAHKVPIIMHVHDEVVVEVDSDDCNQAEKLLRALGNTGPSWATGLPLKVETFNTKFYCK